MRSSIGTALLGPWVLPLLPYSLPQSKKPCLLRPSLLFLQMLGIPRRPVEETMVVFLEIALKRNSGGDGDIYSYYKWRGCRKPLVICCWFGHRRHGFLAWPHGFLVDLFDNRHAARENRGLASGFWEAVSNFLQPKFQFCPRRLCFAFTFGVASSDMLVISLVCYYFIKFWDVTLGEGQGKDLKLDTPERVIHSATREVPYI